MSVRKRSWITSKGEQKSAFICDYVDSNGHRAIATFATEKEAKDFAATVRINVKKGLHTAPSKSITVAEGCERWLKRCAAEGKERSTLAQYGQHVHLHIVPRIGNIKLANLSHNKVEDFRDGLLNGKLSKPLARKVWVSFKTMLKANRHSHVGDGVSIKINKRKQHQPQVGRDLPTPAEVKRMVAAASDGRTRALILLAALTGLRSSELRGLRWADVDLRECQVHVRQRADKYGAIGDPKSDTSTRTVPVDQGVLLPALKEWKLQCPKTEADLVFPDPQGRPIHPEIILRLAKAAMVDAGVVDRAGHAKYDLHALRHFFASWCINPKSKGGRELPPKSVQALMGHSSIVITLDIYGHLFPKADDHEELAASARALLA
jgi:integrase